MKNQRLSAFIRVLFAKNPHLSAFICVLLLYLLLGFLYSAVTPLYEAPDEVWHDAYVRWVARGNGLPPLEGDPSGAYQEAAQPPLYYLAAAAVRRLFPDDDLPDLMWHNPQFGYQAGGTVNDNKNMLVHTDRERFPWRGAALAVHVTRLVSLLFGLLTVLGTWALAREALGPDAPMANRLHWAPLRRASTSVDALRKDSEGRPSAAGPERLTSGQRYPFLPLCAAAFVAFHPQFLFISGIVNNDSAAAATAAFALWAIARVLRRGADLRRAALLGLALGLAALTKTSELLLILPAFVALILSPTPARQKARAGLTALALAAAVGGWWYARNMLLYGDPLGISRHIQTPWGRPEPASLETLLGEMPRLFRSFWGAFGWGHVEYPAWVYALLGGLVLLSLFGWTRGLLRRRIPGHPRILLLAASWCGLVFLALLQWMRQVEAPHGRLLFPALPAWALLMAGGWLLLGKESRVQTPQPQAGGPIGAGRLPARGPGRPASVGLSRPLAPPLPVFPLLPLLLLSLLTPWLVIRPAFAPPRLVDPARVGAGLYRYGDTILLLSASPERASAAPGTWLPLRLCWTATAPVGADYTVVVQLVGRENVRVGERHTYPGLGRFPTSLWPVGRAFCDVYRIRIEPWAPVPELYDVLVGLYRDDPDHRLPVHDLDGKRVEFPTVAQVRIVAQRPLAVKPEHPLDYQLGDSVRLVGYDLEGTLRGGEAITLTLYWRAEEDIGEDYRVFVHLLDPAGNLLAQHDGPPRWGRYPTHAWRIGDLVPDPHVLAVPEGAEAPLALAAGMYLPETMERLPVSGPGGPVPERRVLIPLPPE